MKINFHQYVTQILFLLFSTFSSVAQTTETFQTAGSYTWVCPANVTSVTVQCWGGGGGGGNSNNSTANGGHGGGGGAFSQSTLSVTPGQTYYLSVGSSGSGAPVSSWIEAGDGGDSWFNSIIIIQAVTFCALYVIVLSLFNINFSEREVVDLNDNYKLSSAALLPDRNYASGLISFGIGLLFTELERIRSKFLIFLLLIVFFGSQLILASRGGIITSLAILIFIMIYESVRKKRKSFRLLILIFPILLSLVVFDTSLIRDRFKEESIEDQSGRSEIRQESFSKYMNQDLLEKTLGGGSFHGYTTLAFNKSIHNNFLEVLYDYGLIGVVIFLVSIFRVWRMQLFNKVNILIYCIVSLSLSPIISVVYWVFLVVSFTPYSLKLNKGD